MNPSIFDAVADEFKKNPVEALAALTAILLFLSPFFKGVRSFWVRLWRRFYKKRLTLTPKSIQPTEVTQKPRIAMPRFKYAGQRARPVLISPHADLGIRKPSIAEGDKAAAFQALIFKFENESAGRATDVVARLSFRSANRVTEQAIDYGVWLDSPINCTAMGVGDTRELVVCMVMNNNLFSLDDRRERNHKYHGEAAWFDTRKIGGLELLEIRLVDRRTGATQTFTFRVWREGGLFYVS